MLVVALRQYVRDPFPCEYEPNPHGIVADHSNSGRTANPFPVTVGPSFIFAYARGRQ